MFDLEESGSFGFGQMDDDETAIDAIMARRPGEFVRQERGISRRRSNVLNKVGGSDDGDCVGACGGQVESVARDHLAGTWAVCHE
jgi:hypothetical protein